jgi:hypothetical protein
MNLASTTRGLRPRFTGPPPTPKWLPFRLSARLPWVQAVRGKLATVRDRCQYEPKTETLRSLREALARASPRRHMPDSATRISGSIVRFENTPAPSTGSERLTSLRIGPIRRTGCACQCSKQSNPESVNQPEGQCAHRRRSSRKTRDEALPPATPSPNRNRTHLARFSPAQLNHAKQVEHHQEGQLWQCVGRVERKRARHCPEAECPIPEARVAERGAIRMEFIR